MKRKDCDNLTFNLRRAMPVLCPVICAGVMTSAAVAGTVRVRPYAMVVADDIRLSDVCDFVGLDPITEAQAGSAVLRRSPDAGSSATIHMQEVREILSKSEVNMAAVTLTGAIRCVVSRPANHLQGSVVSSRRPGRMNHGGRRDAGKKPADSVISSPSSRTLRDAVHDHFARALERYRGRPDIVFDRTDTDVLSLPSDTNTFTVRTRKEVSLGLVQVDVDVVTGGREERTIPLVVMVSLVRDVLVAHRAINRGAILKAGDIERMSLTFKHVDGRLGILDAERIIGKRAKRFIAPGTVVRMDLLESVPLVKRGQLVQLRSRAGGIQIITSGKAMQGGMLGDTITVRALDRGRLQFEATIVGAGAVEVGDVSASLTTIARSGRGKS